MLTVQTPEGGYKVGLLSAVGAVFEADGVADLVEQFLEALLLHGLPPRT